ncbi:Trp biosynthesis-associated membrane protein [Nesterenkonia sp. CL21]|uniref:Trp biosynthesis-associated membrane protein n=1 Tax=unclassified Nesterenkonia TaxID=2629769 RepID=UPI00287A8BE4|nr:Trp biosynthesis-associated membrane protein [Nesterenkonia sp. CL21]MDS2171522.1 Trp biosynthesis-associated membrane protein [Nesterenkonia sp. CL21]
MSRRAVVLVGLAAGVLLLASATQTWVTAVGLGDTSAAGQVEIPGTDVSDTVTAMALVGLASSVAVTIARRIARLIIGVVMLAAGVSAVVTVARVIAAPGEASLPALGEVTGTTELAGEYVLGPAVWAGLAGAVLLALAALALLIFSPRWRDRSSRRYATAREAGAAPQEDPDEFDLWDGLSAGDDPTSERRG